MSEKAGANAYRVTVERRSEHRARAVARDHDLMLNVKKGDGSAGFNAAETLLAALGTCILTNVNAIAEKMHLQVDGVRVEIEASRRDEPPRRAASAGTHRVPPGARKRRARREAPAAARVGRPVGHGHKHTDQRYHT